jgi:hypothetical protein
MQLNARRPAADTPGPAGYSVDEYTRKEAAGRGLLTSEKGEVLLRSEFVSVGCALQDSSGVGYLSLTPITSGRQTSRSFASFC